MADRAQRPLNSTAVAAADDDLNQAHAGDARPNALYDVDGNRQPLDPNDPDQTGLRAEWKNAYAAHGGETEASDERGVPNGQVMLPCGQKQMVSPLLAGKPVEIDESELPDDEEPEPEEEVAEDEPELETASEPPDPDDVW